MSIKMHFPQSTNEYALPEYWEQRFERETHYEWFGDYHAFRDLVRPDLKPSSRILILGNGTSRLPFDLVNDGFHNITATDICPNLIQRLNQTEREAIVFEVADALDLPYENESYDIVLEKGTFDTFFAESKSPWNPPLSVLHRMDIACNELRRVLKNDGVAFSISFAQPYFRRPLFEERKWNCIVKSFGEQGCLETFVYRLHKSSQPILSTVPRFWEREQDPIHEGMDDPSFLQNINL